MNQRRIQRWGPLVPWLWWLVAGGGGSLSGDPHENWAEVRAEAGLLSQEALRWKPQDDVEARVWRHEDAAGAAWLRYQGFQVGPLESRAASEGERAWGPGTDLVSGHWGVDLNLGLARAWAVQTPTSLDGGGQVKWTGGGWTWAAGGDRLWSLDTTKSDAVPWTDRAQTGVRWDFPGFNAGLEAHGERSARGATTWTGKGRFRVSHGPGHVSVRGSVDPADGPGWDARGGLGWRPWSLAWTGSGHPGAGVGRYEARWVEGEATAWGAWEPGDAEAGGGWGTDLGALRVVAEASSRWSPAWSGWVSLAAEGGDDVGQWELAWAVKTKGVLGQTLSARWSNDRFEVSGRWKTEGLSLGWLGPRSSVTLALRWYF